MVKKGQKKFNRGSERKREKEKEGRQITLGLEHNRWIIEIWNFFMSQQNLVLVCIKGSNILNFLQQYLTPSKSEVGFLPILVPFFWSVWTRMNSSISFKKWE